MTRISSLEEARHACSSRQYLNSKLSTDESGYIFVLGAFALFGLLAMLVASPFVFLFKVLESWNMSIFTFLFGVSLLLIIIAFITGTIRRKAHWKEINDYIGMKTQVKVEREEKMKGLSIDEQISFLRANPYEDPHPNFPNSEQRISSLMRLKQLELLNINAILEQIQFKSDSLTPLENMNKQQIERCKTYTDDVKQQVKMDYIDSQRNNTPISTVLEGKSQEYIDLVCIITGEVARLATENLNGLTHKKNKYT